MSSSIAALHVAKKQLGLDDDTYRAKLARITGKTSAKDMTEAERQKVLTVFRNEGFAPAGADRRRDGRQKLSGRYAGKLQALWIAGWNLGIVRDRDDAALIAFVKRQTGIDHTRFLHHADDAARVIEALKNWLTREGGVGWRRDRLAPSWGNEPEYRIAQAQFARIKGWKEKQFWVEVRAILRTPITGDQMTRDNWITVMNELGRIIRDQQHTGRSD
ncbi:regulatory protein GemA [Rhizobium mayense]|uniref:Regulatory protein GemA n=1 Tax=Rhizobium mayense TaxID=1312184 RepID=A0ABT7JY85_9HYPH|nr:regulatory protein GemA [Rhizobium mayense]MDL2401275.1 regulatory protein GemA [Rhizobium mayense]